MHITRSYTGTTNSKYPSHSLSTADIEAVEKNDLTYIRKLSHSQVNRINEEGDTLLHCAARFNMATISMILMLKGANIEARNKNDYTPLIMACQHGSYDVAERLEALGADVHAKDTKGGLAFGHTALHFATMYNYEDVTKFLIMHGADMDVKDKFDTSPRDIASKSSHSKIFDLSLTIPPSIKRA